MSERATSRSHTADAVTVLLIGAAAAVVVVLSTVLRFVGTFRDAGVATTIDVDDAPVLAGVGSGATEVPGIVEEVLVIVPDLDIGSRIALAASIGLWALAALVVIGAILLLALNFLRGRVFAASSARAFDVIGWTVVLAAIGILGAENMAANGVLSALGAESGGPLHPREFWAFAPAWAIGTAVGLLGIAFRRGIRLERDVRGLV
jgi:hypothetical protein